MHVAKTFRQIIDKIHISMQVNLKLEVLDQGTNTSYIRAYSLERNMYVIPVSQSCIAIYIVFKLI